MKKKFILAAVVGAAVGAGLHFLYDAVPNVLPALISPVNESVWEHLKLRFFPMLLTAFWLARQTPDRYALWSGIFVAELVMPLFLLGGFYLLGCGFGARSTSRCTPRPWRLATSSRGWSSKAGTWKKPPSGC